MRLSLVCVVGIIAYAMAGYIPQCKPKSRRSGNGNKTEGLEDKCPAESGTDAGSGLGEQPVSGPSEQPASGPSEPTTSGPSEPTASEPSELTASGPSEPTASAPEGERVSEEDQARTKWHAQMSLGEKKRIAQAFAALERTWSKNLHVKVAREARARAVSEHGEFPLTSAERELVDSWKYDGYQLNGALRSNEEKRMLRWGEVATVLYETVELLPHLRRLLYSVHDDASGSNWEERLGSLVSDRGFWQTSTVASVANHTDFAHRIVSVIDSHHNHGGFLGNIDGARRSECRGFFLPGSTFRVMAVKQKENGVFVYLSDRMDFEMDEDIFDIRTGEHLGYGLANRHTTVVDRLHRVMSEFSRVHDDVRVRTITLR